MKFSGPALRTASSHAERKERLGSTFVAAEDQTICQRIHSNCLQRCRQHVVHGHQPFSFWNSTGSELRGEFKTPDHAIHPGLPTVTNPLMPYGLESLAERLVPGQHLAPPRVLLSAPLPHRLGHVVEADFSCPVGHDRPLLRGGL